MCKHSRKRRTLRSRLLNMGTPFCFYCGLPFYAFVLPKGSPGAARSRQFARPTLEHLQAVSNNGETTIENCVLAHGWCNAAAGTRPVVEKLRLRQTLSANNGIAPWWPAIQKIILNQTKHEH